MKRRLARARGFSQRRLTAGGISLPLAQPPCAVPHASANCIGVTIETAVGRVAPSGRIVTLCNTALIPFKTIVATTFIVGVLAVGLGFGLQHPRQATPTIGPAKVDKQYVLSELPADPLPAGAIARIGTSRFRHDDWLHQAIWSPDGKYIASTAGKSFIIWEADTGREVHRQELKDSEFSDPTGMKREWPSFVESLEWSADGNSFLTMFNGLAQHWSWIVSHESSHSFRPMAKDLIRRWSPLDLLPEGHRSSRHQRSPQE